MDMIMEVLFIPPYDFLLQIWGGGKDLGRVGEGRKKNESIGGERKGKGGKKRESKDKKRRHRKKKCFRNMYNWV